jgi:hypothetical protein
MAMLATLIAPGTASAAMIPTPLSVKSCGTLNPDYYFAGSESSSSAYSATAVYGVLRSNIGMCSGPVFPSDASSLWIAVQPRACGFPCVSDHAIIQVGLQTTSDNKLIFFWSAGGCGTAIPTTHQLPGTPSFRTDYEFIITSDASNFYLHSPGGYVSILSRSQSGVSCWANGQLKAEWLAEVHDEGTSFGSVNYPSQVTNMRFRTNVSGSSWVLTSASSSCDFIPARSFNPVYCRAFSSTLNPGTGATMQIWDQ